MNVFDIAELVLKTPVPEESPDREFKRLCTQLYGFPPPTQLEPPKAMFDPSMPRIWPEDDLKVLFDPTIAGPDIDTQMSRGDYGPDITEVNLPSTVFTDDYQRTLTIWDREHWREMELKSGEVYCPVTNTRYPETISLSVFRRLFLRYLSTSKLLEIMTTVFPSVAREVEDTLKVINDPNFHLPSKKAVNKKRKAMDSEPELEEKQDLSKRVICSAYYKMLFKRYDPDAHSSEDLLIIRAMCHLREEDETEEDIV